MNNDQPSTKLTTETASVNSEKGLNLNNVLMKLMLGNRVSEVIYVAVQLNLADLLKNQNRTDVELAEATSTKPDALYRLLRVLDSVGIFEEITPHRFGLTEMGQLLQKGVPGSVYNTALFFGSPRMRKLWENLLYSVETGENANQHVFGIPTWEYYAQHPAEAPLFYNFMTEFSNQVVSSLTTNYNFEEVKVVADVGGAQGNILAGILKANPHLNGLLFDLPHVTQGAQEHLKKQGVVERCQIVGGDMLTPWPFKSDLYLLSRVIHDWDNEQAIAILKNCRRAMEAGSKVVLVERILPEDKDSALLFYLSDLQMLVGPGGQERSLEEYQQLFEAAGLKFTRAIPLNPSFSLIEAIAT
ncbi:MAG: methyltransferase [Microcystaceae cyanobacterium]